MTFIYLTPHILSGGYQVHLELQNNNWRKNKDWYMVLDSGATRKKESIYDKSRVIAGQCHPFGLPNKGKKLERIVYVK